MEADRSLLEANIADTEDQVADMQANLKRMKATSPYPKTRIDKVYPQRDDILYGAAS